MLKGFKKLCGKSLTSKAWPSRTVNVNLKPENRRQGPGHETSWRSQFATNVQKHLNLKVSKVSNNKTDEGS